MMAVVHGLSDPAGPPSGGGCGPRLKHSDGPWLLAAGGAAELAAQLAPVRGRVGAGASGAHGGGRPAYRARGAGGRTGVLGAAVPGGTGRVRKPGGQAAGRRAYAGRHERGRQGVLRRGGTPCGGDER